MVYTRFFALLFALASLTPVRAQQVDYSAFFEEAYRENPGIPRGMLESIAWTNTRMTHLVPGPRQTHDCLGMPQYYGVMGLVEDGKGYFNNTLQKVAELSGYSVADIKRSPRINILAYAKAYAASQVSTRNLGEDFKNERYTVSALSEIPDDGSAHNQYAKDQQYYGVLRRMEQEGQKQGLRRAGINYREIFEENYDLLSAPGVTVDGNGIRNRSTGESYKSFRTAEAPACGQAQRFGQALWSPANSRNYSSRRGEEIEFITIHTVQGSYASCISWFKNAAAGVSAHYVVRSIDGQVTQMVCDNDKAWHVRTHNPQAIGIEHEGFIDEGYQWYTSAMYESSAALVRDLCQRHNINPLQTFQGPATKGVRVLGDNCTKIKGHQHFKGNDHIDPGPYWDWDRYFRLINPKIPEQVFTEKKSEVYDSGGPASPYANQEYRAIRIQPEQAEEVTLEFEAFELEDPDGNTYWDYLDIWDGPDRNGQYLGRFAGSRSPGKIVGTTGALYMEFRSDCATSKAGWKASYTSKRKGDRPAPPANFTSRAVYPLGATLAWDPVKKPDYYLVYLRRRNIGSQRWKLYKTDKDRLHLTGLASDALFQAQLSVVVDGDTSGLVGTEFQTPPISKFGQQPLVMAVPFNSGKFNDSGGESFGYSNSEAWLYSIRPENGKQVRLTFSSFELDPEDSLKIFDGPGASGTLLGSFGGSQNPGTITSSRAAMTLQFTSSKRGTADGWVASWTSSGEATGPAVPVPDPDPDPVPDPPSTVDIDALGPLQPELHFPASPPRIEPDLDKRYAGDFSFGYKTKGRGTEVPFYSLLVREQGVYRGRAGRGFFFDDFTGSTLHADWSSGAGTWEPVGGRLVQRNDREANTALHAAVAQTQWSTYLYHTRFRLSGRSSNKRAGFHFFAANNTQPNRGGGYFVWARDGSTGDFLEIYRVAGDKLDLKKRESVTLEPGKAYDLKVVYNPRKGRMEVYLNNAFTLAWEDPDPIQKGEFVSLRTGEAVVEFSMFEVMKRKSGTETRVEVGPGNTDVPVESPDKNTPVLKVRALLADVRDRLYWSEPGEDETVVTFKDDQVAINDPKPEDPKPDPVEPKPDPVTPKPPAKPSSGGSTSGGSGSGSAGNTGGPSAGTPPSNVDPGSYRGGEPKPDLGIAPSKGVWLGASYSQGFMIEMAPRSNVRDPFFTVANKKNGFWWGNSEQGFLYDDFGSLSPEWRSAVGTWQVDRFGHLVQTDPSVSNANLYHVLAQKSTTTYLYHFRALIQSRRDNDRFGLHFFANDGAATNRGDSYLVWFRNKEREADKAEIYRSTGNVMEQKRAATIDIQPGEWIDVKIMYDPVVGQITVYLNNQLAVGWRDDRIPLKLGSYVSLRTGGSEVLFDDFHVYQRYSGRYYVGVGKDSPDHMQQSTEGRIRTLERLQGDAWNKPVNSDTKIRF